MFILPGGFRGGQVIRLRPVGVGYPRGRAGRAALAGLLQRQPDENLGELVQVGAFAVDGPDGERTLLVRATVGLLGIAAHRVDDA